MLDWIVIGVLYIGAIAFFRFIGGFNSAGEALRRWGAAHGERQRERNRLPSIKSSSRTRRE